MSSITALFRGRFVRSVIASASAMLVFSSVTWSREAKAPELSRFLDKWAASPSFERTGPNGAYAARLFMRFVAMSETEAFSIGSIVSYRFPKKGLPKGADGKPKFDREATAEDIRVAMGFKEWTTRRQKDASVYEAEWTAGNRYVRIYMWEDKDSFSYSIATFRPAYADSFALESELIQRELAGALEQPLPWLRNWMGAAGKGHASAGSAAGGWAWIDAIELPSLFPEAYAQPAPGSPCPVCAPGAPPTCWMTAASCNQAQLSSQINTLNTTLGNAVTSMNNANVQAGAANANWAQTNAQFGQFNQQFAAANSNWAQTNQQFKRTNDLLEKFMKPENAFLFAAATASGAAVGALAVNLAVEGISFVGAAIYEAITHARDDATRLAAFRQAREIWEKASSAAAELESTIDSLLDARRIAKGFGLSRDQIISELGTASEMALAMRDRARRQKDEALARGDTACFKQHAAEAANFTSLLEEVGRLQLNLPGEADDQALCSILLDKLRALRMAEGQLQQARLAILAGQQAFMDQKQREFDEAARQIHRLQNPADHASVVAQRRNRIAAAEANYNRAIGEIDAIAERERRACIREVDDGTVCDRMSRDTHADLDRQKNEINAELRRTDISDSRRTYLNNHLNYLVRWQRWYDDTGIEQCREQNSTNIGAQIPLIGIAFRGSAKVVNWCNTYLNGRPLFRDLSQRRIRAQQARDSALADAERDFRSATQQADATYADNSVHEAEMNAWTEWFRTVRDEQACVVSDLACDTDANEHVLLSRFRRLEAKVPRIERVCWETSLGNHLPTY